MNANEINLNNLSETVNANEKENESMGITKEMETEIKKNLVYATMDLATEYYHASTNSGCTAFINAVWDNKSDLRNMLRKHANWDEKKQAVIFSAEYPREIDRFRCRSFFAHIESMVREQRIKETIDEDKFCLFYDFRQKVMDNLQQFQTAENALDIIGNEVLDENGHVKKQNCLIDFINEKFGMNIHYNKRTSQVVNKVLREVYKLDEVWGTETVVKRDENNHIVRDENDEAVYVTRKYKPYDREFAEFADSINPLKVKKWTVFSINPLDFLTMSFGNSWTSCHTIDKTNKRGMCDGYNGMYCGGTLSYALDKVTVIFYTVDERFNEKENGEWIDGTKYYGFWTQPKIQRQLIHYQGNVMVTGRIYPKGNDGGTDIYKQFREIEQKIVADCLGKPNLWKYDKNPMHNSNYCYTAEDAHNYEDYFCDYSGGTAIIKGDNGEYNANEELMEIGHVGIDLYDGTEIDGDSDYHDVLSEHDQKHIFCAQCGQIIEEDEAYYINGEYYCDDCVFYCEYSGEYHVEDEYHTYVEGYGDICDECIDDAIANEEICRCERCGELVSHRIADNGWYCSEDGSWYCSSLCYEADGLVQTCDGDLIPEFEAVEYDGEYFREEDMVTCDECGQLIPYMYANKNSETHTWICDECLDRKESEATA